MGDALADRRRRHRLHRPADRAAGAGRQVAVRAGPRGRVAQLPDHPADRPFFVMDQVDGRGRPTARRTPSPAGSSTRRRPPSAARSSRTASTRSLRCTPSTGGRSASSSSTSRSTARSASSSSCATTRRPTSGPTRARSPADREGRARVGAENAPAEDPELGLCWGDARINNQLFGPDFGCARSSTGRW